jgi:hypothetical protein
MKCLVRISILAFGIALTLSACAYQQRDHAGPAITDITTSDKVLVISDCPATSVTVTAKVTDESNIKSVLLWYRVNADQPFAFTRMNIQSGMYTAAIQGADLQGNGYGAMEFYITAEDAEGNSSESPLDNSVQFLPCVNN